MDKDYINTECDLEEGEPQGTQSVEKGLGPLSRHPFFKV
jgi:hypothetical protein